MYIIVGGAGIVGGVLASKLIANKHDVVVIDQDKKKCDKIYMETGVVAIHGGVSQMEVLHEAGINKADIVVAATVNDVDNLALSILAKSLNVPRIIVRMRDPMYEKAYQIVGVDSIVRVTDLMVNQFVLDIENPDVKRISSICGGRADIFTTIISENSKVVGQAISEVANHRKFPSQCVFTAIYNPQKGEFDIPRGDRVLDVGDEVFLVSTAKEIQKALDFLTAGATREKKETVEAAAIGQELVNEIFK